MERISGKKYASAEQKLRLVSLVEADPQLRCGKFSATFSKAEGKRRWQQISEELNSISGAKKTWDEWRKTWQDRKSNAKKKFAALRRCANLTGGGPPPESPTLEESLIINTIDRNSLVGHIDSQESLSTIIDLSEKPKISGVESIQEFDLPPPKDFTDVINVAGTSNKDLPPPPIGFNDEYNVADASTKENRARENCLPGGIKMKQKRTVAQRRLQQGLKTAETLNENFREKINMKKKFYADFLQLHTEYVKSISLQTQALVDIAAALNRKCNCNVLQSNNL